MSSSRRIRCSSPSILISLPVYLPKSTRSPAFTSTAISLPSSRRPFPTATTLPSWGFSLAVSGMMIPPTLRSSFSSILLTMTRSCSGRIFIAAIANTPSPRHFPQGAARVDSWFVGLQTSPPDTRSARAARVKVDRLYCSSRGGTATRAGDDTVLHPAEEECGSLGGRFQDLADRGEGFARPEAHERGLLRSVHRRVIDGEPLPPHAERRPAGHDGILPRALSRPPDLVDRPVDDQQVDGRHESEAEPSPVLWRHRPERVEPEW